MKRYCSALIAVVSLAGICFAQTRPQVKLETTLGDIVIELNATRAPKTVENFLAYVNSGFYNGTIFHRVIKTFMIQGGGFTEDLQQKSSRPPVANEADNGLRNLRGTVAMARTPNPHSATSQFFINTVDNAFLDFKSKTDQGWGYCVFGKVVKGMETVDAIAKTPTTMRNGMGDVPGTAIIIKKATVIGKKPSAKKAVEAKPGKEQKTETTQ
ncbi:MAG: peptidyl-prolyl cis-trans isomerase [Chitinispirillaceae bacterium]|nr:peptidyl-prolyl cis-trans isomerase [Chitinispirillaceae bacterium]